MTQEFGVLLATCNSEKFLSEQLSSVIRSVPAPAQIIVSDDDSTDGTIAILEAMQTVCLRKGIRLCVHKNAAVNKGVHGNFRNLLSLGADSNLEVFFLCDHDDIWCETKIAKSLAKFCEN